MSERVITDRGSYAQVNGLRMYYEVHGSGDPLVLLHGALSATGTSFGALLPELARTRRVIAVEQQGHGRTADIDRPLTVAQMADDTTALLDQLGIGSADLFGYSMGAAIAMDLAIRRPELVRRLLLASATYNARGLHPGILDGIEYMTPENLAGSPFEEEYLRTAPDPQGWPQLLKKIQQLDRNLPEFAPEAVAGIEAPTLLMVGDSDIVQPEHAVRMFRLLGGAVAGDLVGMPRSQLAILPGTAHAGLTTRVDLLLPAITRFLDGPPKSELPS